MPHEEFKVINPTLSAAYKKSLVDKGYRREDAEIEGILADLQGKFPVGRVDMSNEITFNKYHTYKHYIAATDFEIGNLRIEDGQGYYLVYNVDTDKTTVMVRYGSEGMQFITYDIDNETLYTLVGGSEQNAKYLDGTVIIDPDEAQEHFDQVDHIYNTYDDHESFLRTIRNPDTIGDEEDYLGEILEIALFGDEGGLVDVEDDMDSYTYIIDLEECDPIPNMPSKSDIDIAFKVSGYEARPAFGGRQHFVNKMYPKYEYWVELDDSNYQVLVHTKLPRT